MSHREQLRRHLEFFRELGVEGISRDARWRVRDPADPVILRKPCVRIPCVILRIPCVILRIPCVILRIPCVILRIPCVILRKPCVILRMACAGRRRTRPAMTGPPRP